jgi:hypothetical protein
LDCPPAGASKRALKEPTYRSEHGPIERMMDEIAGRGGFYGPFFEPVFKEAHASNALLTFDTVMAVLDGGFRRPA